MFANIVVGLFIAYIVALILYSIIKIELGKQNKVTSALKKTIDVLGVPFGTCGNTDSSAGANMRTYDTDYATGQQIANLNDLNRKIENFTGKKEYGTCCDANAMIYDTTIANGKIIGEQERLTKNIENLINMRSSTNISNIENASSTINYSDINIENMKRCSKSKEGFSYSKQL